MTETIYALYPVFAASQELRAELFEDDALGNAADEIETLFKEWAGRVDVRGSYSTVGFRADADLVLWLTADHAGGPPAVRRRVPQDARRRPPRPGRLDDGARQTRGVHARSPTGLRAR